MSELKEPAIKARLSPTNQALFETVEEFLRWTAQIAPYGDFLRYHRTAQAEGTAIQQYLDYRSPAEQPALEAVLKKTMCTDGRSLFEVMQEKGNKKAR